MKRVFLPLFVFLIALFSTKAQMTPKQKDSILQIYPSVSSIEKLRTIDRLVNYYQKNQPDSVLYYNDILLHEAQQQNNKKHTALYYYNLGIYDTFQEEYYEAIANFNRAIAIQKEKHFINDLADTYKAVAGCYFYSENYDKSLEVCYNALKIYEQLNDKKGIVEMLGNLVLINKKAGNYITAIKLSFKAEKIMETLHLQEKKGKLYNNLGLVYKEREMYDSALYYYKKSMPISKKNNDKRGLELTYYNLANLYAFNLENKDSAEYYYQKSLVYAKKYDKKTLLYIQSRKAEMLLKYGSTDKGIKLMKKVLAKAKMKDDKATKELAYFKLYEGYKKQHEWQLALKNLEAYMAIQDTIGRQKNKIKLARIESKYQNEKKQAKIHRLELKQKLDKKIKIYLSIAIALLFLSFALIGYNFINKQKRNRLEQELLKAEKEKLHQDVRFKTKQLTSQALMMMQKNKLIDDILSQLSTIKGAGVPVTDLNKLKRKLKKSLHSEDDWELFKHYFEEINKDFFKRLKQINPKITPAEQRLAALVKLRFNIKETAELLNISPDSVKTARSQLRKKLGLVAGENMYDFLNTI